MAVPLGFVWTVPVKALPSRLQPAPECWHPPPAKAPPPVLALPQVKAPPPHSGDWQRDLSLPAKAMPCKQGTYNYQGNPQLPKAPTTTEETADTRKSVFSSPPPLKERENANTSTTLIPISLRCQFKVTSLSLRCCSDFTPGSLRCLIEFARFHLKLEVLLFPYKLRAF